MCSAGEGHSRLEDYSGTQPMYLGIDLTGLQCLCKVADLVDLTNYWPSLGGSLSESART